jgi:serine/threonine protein kinase
MMTNAQDDPPQAGAPSDDRERDDSDAAWTTTLRPTCQSSAPMHSIHLSTDRPMSSRTQAAAAPPSLPALQRSGGGDGCGTSLFLSAFTIAASFVTWMALGGHGDPMPGEITTYRHWDVPACLGSTCLHLTSMLVIGSVLYRERSSRHSGWVYRRPMMWAFLLAVVARAVKDAALAWVLPTWKCPGCPYGNVDWTNDRVAIVLDLLMWDVMRISEVISNLTLNLFFAELRLSYLHHAKDDREREVSRLRRNLSRLLGACLILYVLKRSLEYPFTLGFGKKQTSRGMVPFTCARAILSHIELVAYSLPMLWVFAQAWLRPRPFLGLLLVKRVRAQASGVFARGALLRWFNAHGTLKIADFGLSRLMETALDDPRDDQPAGAHAGTEGIEGLTQDDPLHQSAIPFDNSHGAMNRRCGQDYPTTSTATDARWTTTLRGTSPSSGPMHSIQLSTDGMTDGQAMCSEDTNTSAAAARRPFSAPGSLLAQPLLEDRREGREGCQHAARRQEGREGVRGSLISPGEASQSSWGVSSSCSGTLQPTPAESDSPLKPALMTAWMGTLHWMAPELMVSSAAGTGAGTTGAGGAEVPSRGFGLYSSAVDVYATGVLLWQLATCRSPAGEYGESDRDGLAAMMRLVRDEGRRPVFPVDSHRPASWEALVQRCWDAQPAERPPIGAVLNKVRKMQREAARERM